MVYIQEIRTLLSKNIRDYGMFIALVAIMGVFTILTDCLFISPGNISNLINATGYIAVLAVGMTLVIVIRTIDLSVGFLAGFCGAIAALLMVVHGLDMVSAILVVLAIGLGVGLLNAFFIAKIGMPAFVVTLAGMLIFRGALLQATAGTGTISLPNQFHARFNAIGNGFVPDIPHQLGGIHLVTMMLGILGIVLLIALQLRQRSAKKGYGFVVSSVPIFAGKLAIVTLGIGYVVWVLASHNGLSWTVAIVMLVVLLYHFITTKTVLGRHVYAVGSNPDAARLSGISVTKITFFVFGSMGMLAALSGILFTARLQSATPTAGTLFELDAIAAAYVGGVSAAGGVGKVTNSIIGALVMASLPNGMNLMGVGSSYQFIVRGLVLLAAVAFDVISRNKNR